MALPRLLPLSFYSLSLSCSVMALLLINIARVIVFVDQLEINFRIALANSACN